MGDDPTRGIRELLNAQNSQPTVEILQIPSVLPPIGGRAHSSVPIFDLNFPKGQDKFTKTDLGLGEKLASIRRFSLVSRTSTKRSASPADPSSPRPAPFPPAKGITRVAFQIAQLPAILPAIPGLSFAVDNLTSHRLESIIEACRLYDSEKRGYLSQPSVLKCIGEVVPSAHAVDSPWREFLEEIAPHGEFIDYQQLLELIGRSRSEFPVDPGPLIPEVLGTMTGKKLLEELPSRPTSSQASREQGRVQIMLEIETILLRNPHLDIEQLKMISHQKVMEQEEFLTLLELYGLLEHFQPFLSRLLDSFLTHDSKFHYSAFIGCLQTIQAPPIEIKPEDLGKSFFWQGALPPLGKSAIPRPNGSAPAAEK